MQIEGSVVFITGGGAGIGAAMAKRFSEAGPEAIIVADIDIRAADAVAASIDGHAVHLDVADAAQTHEVLTRILERFGRIDLLCLNAGVATGGTVEAPDEDWQRAWEINVMAHVRSLRVVLPSMLAHGSGHILVTASAAGLLTNIGAAPYSVTKHGAVALAEWVAVTYGERGIGVSCLCPQFVDTAMLGGFDEFDEAMRAWVGNIAISVEDVAESVVGGLTEDRFLILPHPEVAAYLQHKVTDREGWILQMQELQKTLRYEP